MKRNKKVKRTILIVDDEEYFCRVLKAALETTGDFMVSTCSNSDEAVQRVEQIQPDVVLLDIMMPGVSGSEVARELKSKANVRGIPIIFLTALVREEEIERSKGVIGGDRFLAKPVQMNDLINVIDELTLDQSDNEPG